MTTLIAIAVVEHAGQFLVGLRPAGVRFAGFHEFPGGKANAGELPETAAERECLEETGLSVLATETLLVVDDAAATLRLHFIRCQIVGNDTQPRTPFRWVRRGQLAECRFPPANVRVVELLLNNMPPCW